MGIMKSLTTLAYLTTLSLSAPVPITRPGSVVSYKLFTGNGSPTAGWPTKSSFLSFPDLWNLHEANFNACPGQTASETQQLKRAILTIDKETAYNDPAGILAQVVQESGGCIRVKSTIDPSGSISNAGLLQSCDGKATCAGLEICPYEVIEQMIRDGVAPNAKESDLVDARIKAGGKDDAMTLFRAARIYNSGMHSIQPPTDGALWSSAMMGTECYASDYANIRMGYVGLSCGK